MPLQCLFFARLFSVSPLDFSLIPYYHGPIVFAMSTFCPSLFSCFSNFLLIPYYQDPIAFAMSIFCPPIN
nr:MAG TPA: hypothetical protein [Bacteriophage sp.]